MSSIVLIQARTNSSRLPAKSLLPVGGVPLAVLSAKRAASTGMHVIVLTSSETSDDYLARTVEESGIEVFRGSLNNTLDRFVKAVARFDGVNVFRLTADNVFPNGQLLEEIEAQFEDSGADYILCGGKDSGLPHGMAAELFKLECLREAYANTKDLYDLEHVTPYIRREKLAITFDKYSGLDLSGYRCTVDDLDDYLQLLRVFERIEDPVRASIADLLSELRRVGGVCTEKRGRKKLVFGAAQLGMEYGVANTVGIPSHSSAQQMVRLAIANNVSTFDTAAAYGKSESVLGECLNKISMDARTIVTKLDPLDELVGIDGLSAAHVRSCVQASVYKSCRNLRTNSLDCLLLHRASHLDLCNGSVLHELISLREAGVIAKLGVSVQSPTELIRVLDNSDICVVQMPFNILDWRWDEAIERVRYTKEIRPVEIHVRSALLQGLLLVDDRKTWANTGCDNVDAVFEWIEKITEKQPNMLPELFINYVKSQSWVDGVIVGMESERQLKQNLKIFELPDLSLSQIAKLIFERPMVAESVLNPANWNNGE